MDTRISDRCLTAEQRERCFRAAQIRRSVGAFCGTPSPDQLGVLAYIAEKTELEGARLALFECGDELFFSSVPDGRVIGCRNACAVIADRSVPSALLNAGFAGELFVLETVAQGLGACWVTNGVHRKRIPVSLNGNERIAAVIAFGETAETPEGPRKRRPLRELCRTDPSAWPLWAYNAAECVRSAPSGWNLQPWRLAFAGNTLLLLRGMRPCPLDMGVALLHLLLGVGDRSFSLTPGRDREVACLIVEE